MSQSMSDLLGKRNFSEPPEIKQIKDFVQAEIGIIPKVDINTESFVIRVTSAAAAGALRIKLFKLQEQLDSKKRVVIRIG